MRIGIFAVGKLKQGPERELCARYVERAKLSGKPRVEGLPHCDWVLVDGGDVIVHIFRPEVREFYHIEKMWQAEFAADAN